MLTLVTPLIRPAILQPEDSGGCIRRIVLADLRLNDLAVYDPDIDLFMLEAAGAGKKASLYPIIGLSLPAL